MAVAFDQSSNLASGTGTRSWTHTPVGTPRGVVVVVTGPGADTTTGVTYGGTAMSREATASLATGEPGNTTVWFLGAGLGTGGKTVAVTRSSTTFAYIATAFTVTGATDTVLVDFDNQTSANTSTMTVTLTIPSGRKVFVVGGVYSGENALGSVADNAANTDVHQQDFGNFVSMMDYRTDIYTGTGGDLTDFGWTQSNDDAAWAGIAISDLALTGTVTGVAPAPSGTVTGTKQEAEAYTGTVTGVAPATSGTVTGTAARKGTVVGVAPATSGTVTDTTQRSGTVTGLAPATSGTVTATKGGKGTVTGVAPTASGVVTGTKFEPSNDKSGTVTGVAPATSGTVIGRKATTGTATGAATASGTVTGTGARAGTVVGTATATGTASGTAARIGTATGSATASGTASGTVAYPGNNDKTGTVTGLAPAPAATATGTAARAGAITGQATATGTATGTKATSGTVTGDATVTGTVGSQPVPVAPARRGGSSYYPARPNVPQRQPAPLVRKSGKVHGTAVAVARVAGRKASTTRIAAPITYRCEVRGTKATSGITLARIETRAAIRGDGITPISTADLRRLRDDADLMLML